MTPKYRCQYFLFVIFSKCCIAQRLHLFRAANFGVPNVTTKDFIFNQTAEDSRCNISEIVRASADDKYLNTAELLRKYLVNRTVEEYVVVTADGYALTLFRAAAAGPPVLLMHGIFLSSDDFVTAGPNNALAYLLANATYDVWLGNARGNKYSKRNIYYPTSSREFWNFTWNEIGYFDLPAIIDTVLEKSGRADLTYIGYSQGTTAFFVLCSLRPEYNNKIRLFIGLATVAYQWHVKSPLTRAIVPFRQQVYDISQALGLYQIFPDSPAMLFVFSVLCTSSRLALTNCMTFLFLMLGFDYGGIDYENLPVEISHFPADSSFKQVVHYLQLTASRRFAQYDHGKKGNLAQYKQTTPPSYPVEKVAVPVVVFYANNDFLSVYQDVKLLIRRLPNVKRVIRVPNPYFNHMDYMWGKDAPRLVYRPLLDILNQTFQS